MSVNSKLKARLIPNINVMFPQVLTHMCTDPYTRKNGASGKLKNQVPMGYRFGQQGERRLACRAPQIGKQLQGRNLFNLRDRF